MSLYPMPKSINLHQRSKRLEIAFDNDEKFTYSCEYLRCFSPSAEVQGHGPGEEVLQTGKENIGIDNIEQIGNYAVCLHFDDGHKTGIYSWETLYKLGKNQDANWNAYLKRLDEAGIKRKTPD